MKRVHNFSAGPAALPLEALQLAHDEFLDFEQTGMNIMEMSHRGAVYDAVHEEARALLRELGRVPDTHDVLFLTGGATAQFAQVPLNLRSNEQSADYVVAGVWGEKALKEARQTGKAREAASSKTDSGYFSVPELATWDLDPQAAYLHYTSNNTVTGTQMHEFPEKRAVPQVVDMSSDILSRPFDFGRVGLAYAGAQKNLGPSGVTVVIADKTLIENARTDIPFIWQYRTQAAQRSLANTAPTFSIYMLRNVLRWLKGVGGVSAIESRNRAKAEKLYDVLESRADVYSLKVERSSRSFMNVVWNLETPELEKRCVAEATGRGLIGLKGHRLVGGMRASIYNAVPGESVDALCEFLLDFQV